MQKICFKKQKKQLYKSMKGYSLMAKLPVSEIGNRGSNPLILEFLHKIKDLVDKVNKKLETYKNII